jgi:hypothetical protein
MYTDIANFLSATPEWVKNWLDMPMKAVTFEPAKLNPLLISEIVANILIYLPLDKFRGIHKMWDKEIDFATGEREKFLKELTLNELHQFYSKHSAWSVEVRTNLYQRDQQAIDRYWEAVSEYEDAHKELDCAYERHWDPDLALTNMLYEKFRDSADKKREAFTYQVEIEKLILHYGFAHDAKRDQILCNIYMLFDGFDPHDIPASIEEADPTNWQSDYWKDEDPDDISTQTEDTDFSEVEWF